MLQDFFFSTFFTSFFTAGFSLLAKTLAVTAAVVNKLTAATKIYFFIVKIYITKLLLFFIHQLKGQY